MVLGEGLLLACVGLVLGLVGSYFVGKLMQSTLYGVSAMDYSVFGAVGVLLVLAGLLASYLPARRASRVEPVRALRAE
jgi:putative ABC transport system permease protein